MEIMTRTQLKKLWTRTKTDPKFRRLLLAMLAALVCVPSNPRDQSKACALADFTLKKAGAGWRRGLRRILKNNGWEFQCTHRDG
jgi:hypothetical protein